MLLVIYPVQLWYARYPNAELVLQPLVFAGLLAYVRAQRDDDRFFAPVAALLLALSIFAHITGVFAVAALGIAALLSLVYGRPAQRAFWLTLVMGSCLAAAYLAIYLAPYARTPIRFVSTLQPIHLAMLATAVVIGTALLIAARRPAVAARLRTWVPAALVMVAWTLAIYAFFFRSTGGTLAQHDADSLRTFIAFYFSPYALVVVLVGFTLVARSFVSSGALLVLVALFSFFFFYKIRIVPEHFWAARRFAAVILPGFLLLVGTAWFPDLSDPEGKRLTWLNRGTARAVRQTAGIAFVLLLGWRFWDGTRPLLRHVEYAGVIPRVEQLAATFNREDLVLVESRNASDTHVLALPLAYIYAKDVLVFVRSNSDKQAFREFLEWSFAHYRRVFFLGGGGTELLSRTMTVVPVLSERLQIPEYESARNAYPRSVKLKVFDLDLYKFLPRHADSDGFDLEVGAANGLYVRRFYAKERHPNGFTHRWTRDDSYVSIVGTRPAERLLTIWMDDGGRPEAAEPAEVEVFLNDRRLGAVSVRAGQNPYRFAIPPDLAAAIAQDDDAAQLRIATPTWSPARFLGDDDDRELGVLVSRIRISTDEE